MQWSMFCNTSFQNNAANEQLLFEILDLPPNYPILWVTVKIVDTSKNSFFRYINFPLSKSVNFY